MRAISRTSVLLLIVSVGMPAVAWTQVHPANGSQTRRDVAGRTNLQGVLTDSLRLLTLEHSTRIAVQEKTRRELGGIFWKDYRASLRVPRQWGDGDGWLVNYVGHPGHGAAAGFIWAHHDPNGNVDDAGFGRRYWASRLRATGWGAAYSLQFEIGPFSEASIGNVGKNPATVGWVDHVVTPIGGLGVMLAEDALDRYVVSRLERRVQNSVFRALLRTALNPARSMANLAGARPPWHRDRSTSAAPTPASQDAAVTVPVQDNGGNGMSSGAEDAGS